MGAASSDPQPVPGQAHIPFVATDHEMSHGREISWRLRANRLQGTSLRSGSVPTSWIAEVTASGTRDGKPFQATHLFLTSLSTRPEALLQLVRDRWSNEGWQWNTGTQLHEDAHRYRGNGARVLATLRNAAPARPATSAFLRHSAGHTGAVQRPLPLSVAGDQHRYALIQALL